LAFRVLYLFYYAPAGGRVNTGQMFVILRLKCVLSEPSSAPPAIHLFALCMEDDDARHKAGHHQATVVGEGL
jgi:hypothetical protein